VNFSPEKKGDQQMFQCNERHGNGFWITLANGYKVSVQFDRNNYCDNNTATSDGKFQSSKDAEVAVITPEGRLYRLDGEYEDVKGYVSPNELIEILQQVSKLTFGHNSLTV